MTLDGPFCGCDMNGVQVRCGSGYTSYITDSAYGSSTDVIDNDKDGDDDDDPDLSSPYPFLRTLRTFARVPPWTFTNPSILHLHLAPHQPRRHSAPRAPRRGRRRSSRSPRPLPSLRLRGKIALARASCLYRAPRTVLDNACIGTRILRTKHARSGS